MHYKIGTRRSDMKRLTYFDCGKWRLKIGDTEYSGKAVDRLAAYEDTCLEPEEIEQLKGEMCIRDSSVSMRTFAWA